MSEPVPANRKESFDQLKQAGDYLWSLNKSGGPARILFVCPCGCGDLTGVPVRPESGGGPVWNWNQDLERPTLTPSLQRIDSCRWHGYLTDGYFRQC